MSRVASLAYNTFRETIRDRVLGVILVFAFGMIGLTVLLGTLTIGEELKIIKDLGLSAIELFGVAIALFVGTSMLHKEIDKRTIYIVLSKPVPRWQLLVGKFLGLLMTLSVLLLAMGSAYLGLVWLKAGSFQAPLVVALAFIGIQLTVLVALTLFFSTFSSPVMSMVYTAGLYLVGHNTENLLVLTKKAAPAMKAVAEGLYWLLPNLSTFDLKNRAVYGEVFSMPQWSWAIAYAGLYTAALLLAATGILERREF